jgi:quercetin dioxygenase-like cupin family protein
MMRWALVIGVSLVSATLWAAPPKKAAMPSYWGHVDSAPAFAVLGGKAIARLVNEGEAYMGILEGFPGLVVPEHTHANEIELLYVLQGGGVMTIAGKEMPVRPGMAIQVPRGVKHAFRIPADAKEKFVAVQVYTPSGPQTRFRKGKPVKGGAPK